MLGNHSPAQTHALSLSLSFSLSVSSSPLPSLALTNKPSHSLFLYFFLFNKARCSKPQVRLAAPLSDGDVMRVYQLPTLLFFFQIEVLTFTLDQ